MVIFHSYVSLPEGKKIDEGKVDVWTPDGPWVRFHWPIPVEDVGQGSSLGQQTNELRRRETLMVVMNSHEQSPKWQTGWWFGTWLLFSHILGVIIPTDFHIFQDGYCTTNQQNIWS